MMKKLKILFLAAEAAPFVKVGGLGDVAGSLPAAIRALPEKPDLRVALLLHPQIDRGAFDLKPVAALTVAYQGGVLPAEVYETKVFGVPVYLVSGEPVASADEVYSADTYKDGVKYTFFSLATLALAKALDFQPDVVHAHDWHTAAAVYALKVRRDPFFDNTASLLTVHNLPYLGNEAGPALGEFGLPPAEGGPLPDWARHVPLPLGLLAADKINTVSPGYAAEMLTLEFGAGLEGFLASRKEDLFGALNGLDLESWNPEIDPALPVQFSRKTLVARKKNKERLELELGFTPQPNLPLVAFIGRMDYQKGIEIGLGALRKIEDLPWRALLLGSGDPALEDAARQLAANYPERAWAAIRFDGGLARRIYAGADIILIPSRYEPCGLIQMIAMRYGCVPVARAVGGLKDTIADYDAVGDSTGFLFQKASPEALAEALKRAFGVFADRRRWRGLQLRGMGRDFSWSRSAREYLDVYYSLAASRSGK